MPSKDNTSNAERSFTVADLWGRDGRPAASDVRQKDIGDCYLVAAAGAIAEQTPHEIRDAIRLDEETGSFTVRLFKDGEPQIIQVTQAELRSNLNKRGGSSYGASPEDGDGGLWPAVIEVGYVKLKWGDWETHWKELEGGYPDEALATLTGKQPETLLAEGISNRSMKDIANEINDALEADKRVLLGTNRDPNLGKTLAAAAVLPGMGGLEAAEKYLAAKTDGVVGGHVYMVMGARHDPASDDTILRIRNPWAQNEAGLLEWDKAAEVDVSMKKLQEHSFNRFDLGQLTEQQRELYGQIRQEVGGRASDDAVALATAEANRAGITSVAQLRAATVTDDGKLWVAGQTPGFRAMVDTRADVPPSEESLRDLVAEAQRQQEEQATRQQDPASVRMG